eukprot:gnl/TRDRNA2_/TRDRNA2_80697_c0_seq1.p1 gnl/TRDRNA2_/TRDRNA2_80697_c0~~gnl/TRDRNA2_/TRDRNA2_80697_c0_seq1.p1  ORF type:complete len:171 (-),score=24.20 gnl/TRDRNA2_/TRDRNA2_80697_c0_seq1:35-496(-)
MALSAAHKATAFRCLRFGLAGGSKAGIRCPGALEADTRCPDLREGERRSWDSDYDSGWKPDATSTPFLYAPSATGHILYWHEGKIPHCNELPLAVEAKGGGVKRWAKRWVKVREKLQKGWDRQWEKDAGIDRKRGDGWTSRRTGPRAPKSSGA